MNDIEYELDLENVERCLPKLEFWIKEEEINLEELKEILNDMVEDYSSNNIEYLSLYNDKLKDWVSTINSNNKKIYDELEEAILFHDQIKREIEEKVI